MLVVYNIADSDRFDIQLYPEVAAEIGMISMRLHQFQSAYKSAIVISYLKDHCINATWIQGNEDCVKMIRSAAMDTAHTEALFTACKHNSKFLAGYEQYISSSVHRGSAIK